MCRDTNEQKFLKSQQGIFKAGSAYKQAVAIANAKKQLNNATYNRYYNHELLGQETSRIRAQVR